MTTHKIGVITLPAFYEDIEARRKGDKDYRSASRDVAKLVTELKQDKVDGLLIDLRNNGGGSLTEAIDLTGLFVGKGPVVQQRNAKGEVKVESDDLPAPLWNGPLEFLSIVGQRPHLRFCSGGSGLWPGRYYRRTKLRQGHSANRGQS